MMSWESWKVLAQPAFLGFDTKMKHTSVHDDYFRSGKAPDVAHVIEMVLAAYGAQARVYAAAAPLAEFGK